MPTTTPFNNLITFSRGSNATVTGSNGLIQWAPNNLITHSEQFDNAAWTKGGVSVTANNAVAPDGTTTADLLTGTGATPRVFQLATLINGASYTATCYVRQGTSTSIGFDIVNIQTGPVFTFATKTWSALSGVITAASFQELADGWFRLIVTFTSNTTSAGPGWYVSGNTTAWIWGAQLELGSTATTYNPTTVKNLLGFSEAFDNAAWTKSGSSIVTGAQANPVNGLFNAQKLMEDTSTGQHRVFNTTGVTYIASTPVCFSAYVKAAERSFVYFRLNNSGADFVTGFVNLTTGAVTTVTGAGSITATSVGSGWWRIAAIGTSAAATPVSGYIATATSGSVVSYTGDGNSGVYIYGAQLCDSASLDPYVPTPGAAPSSTAFYGPRFDFDPVTLQPRGLLVEEQRTNLLTYSDDFGNAAWGKARGGVATNTTASPDGTTNADTLTATATGTYAAAFRGAVSYPGGAAYTLTVYAKANVGQHLILYINETGDVGRANFNLNTGAIGNISAGTTASITAAGNGWWRCAVTATPTVTASGIVIIGVVDSNTVTTVTSGQSLFLYGAQLEAGAFATSYIPTVASTVTRSADVAMVTGQNFAQWYGPAAGTFVAVGDYLINANWRRFLTADDVAASGNNRIIVNGDQNQQLLVTNGGVTQASLNAGTAPAANVVTKIASAFALDNFGAVRDGGTVATDASGTLPTVNRLAIGLHPNGGEYLNGHIRSINFIPARAADFQLQALST